MAKEIVTKLVDEIREKEDVREKLRAMKTFEEVFKYVRESGYPEATVEDLLEVENTFRKERAEKSEENAEGVKLSFDELENVAGGTYWYGESASDGHEMGCDGSYHHIQYQLENNEWCRQSWYCQKNHITEVCRLFAY